MTLMMFSGRWRGLVPDRHPGEDHLGGDLIAAVVIGIDFHDHELPAILDDAADCNGLVRGDAAQEADLILHADYGMALGQDGDGGVACGGFAQGTGHAAVEHAGLLEQVVPLAAGDDHAAFLCLFYLQVQELGKGLGVDAGLDFLYQFIHGGVLLFSVWLVFEELFAVADHHLVGVGFDLAFHDGVLPGVGGDLLHGDGHDPLGAAPDL